MTEKEKQLLETKTLIVTVSVFDDKSVQINIKADNLSQLEVLGLADYVSLETKGYFINNRTPIK